MRTREEIRARSRARYAEDPFFRAAKLRAAKRAYDKKRETILYEKRVTYHQGAKEKRLEASARCHKDPEKKRHYAERSAKRRSKRRGRQRSRQEFQRAEFLKGLSLIELERPSYRIFHAGTRTTERWPLKDDAARWLAEHDAPKVSRQGDTSAA